MDWFLKKHVSELNLVENHLIQVLLSEFHIHGNRHKANLHLGFNGKTPAIRRRESKMMIRNVTPDFHEKSKKLQGAIDAVLLDHTSNRFELCPHDNFVFRYASGGVLPILSIDGTDYYCLFYRDIDPIGWNIANGGCDSFEELLDPLHTMLRELQEELMIFDFHKQEEYSFSYRSRSQADLIEFQTARKLWQNMFPNESFEAFRRVKARIDWIEGPDNLSIRFGQDQLRNISNCFINVNATDFGIEIDKIARISLSSDVKILDGEIINNLLLRSPIGLFEIDKFSSVREDHDYEPDRLFYDGVERDKSEFLRVINDELWPRLLDSRNPIRSSVGKQKWDEEQIQYKLCPVAKALIHRHNCCVPTHKQSNRYSGGATYDVFISHASKDKDVVLRVIEDLKNLRISYWVDHEQIIFGDFITDKIEDGLQRSNSVLVCISKNLRRSNWCRREYGPIIKRNLDGNSAKKVFPLRLDDGEDDDIPLLMYDMLQADYNDKNQYNELLQYIKTFKGR